MRLISVFGAIVLSVAGCSTGAQREATRMQTVAAELQAKNDACFQHIADNPDYAALKLKTPLDVPPQYLLQMMNDQTSPNKKEISLLYRVNGDMQGCRKIALDGVSKMHPLILTTLVEFYSNSDKLWGQATAGRLTWGQFNQSRKDLRAQVQQKMMQADAQIRSELQSQNQAELAQRQQAAAALGAGLKAAGDAYGNMPMPQRPIQCNTIATGGGNSSTTCQ
jgi:hypothetical protein